jgi:hypothetical protein
MRLSANAGGPIVLMGALQLMLAIRLILDDRFALWPTNHNGHSQASLAITLGAVALCQRFMLVVMPQTDLYDS